MSGPEYVVLEGYELGEFKNGSRAAVSADGCVLIAKRDQLEIRTGEFSAELPIRVLRWLLDREALP